MGLLHCSPPCQSLSKLNSHSDAALIEEKLIPLLDQVSWSPLIDVGNSADQQVRLLHFLLLCQALSAALQKCKRSYKQEPFFAESI